MREYHRYSLTANKSLFLAAAVRAPYLCALPSATYLSAIGQTLPATAAAYMCDCDLLDQHSHGSDNIQPIGCLPAI